LASRYGPDQHGTYLRHLREAAKNPKNLNIALTGRYGTGKSSVLDEFKSENPNRTLRLAISTLGPNSEGVNLTNRIQKELVKQLLYRAASGEFRFSRFNRIVPLSRRRATGEATEGGIKCVWWRTERIRYYVLVVRPADADVIGAPKVYSRPEDIEPEGMLSTLLGRESTTDLVYVEHPCRPTR
jgi:Cdc6-like AAA superfamily ATPase